MGESRDHPHHGWKTAVVSDVTPRMSLVLQLFLPDPNSCLGTSPHQQGWDTKMAELSFGGIDVSKDRLDVLLLPRGIYFSVRNAPGGQSWLQDCAHSQSLRLALSRAVSYERGIIRTLLAADSPCDASTRISFVSLPAPAVSWPRMIVSTLD